MAAAMKCEGLLRAAIRVTLSKRFRLVVTCDPKCIRMLVRTATGRAGDHRVAEQAAAFHAIYSVGLARYACRCPLIRVLHHYEGVRGPTAAWGRRTDITRTSTIDILTKCTYCTQSSGVAGGGGAQGSSAAHGSTVIFWPLGLSWFILRHCSWTSE